MIEGEFVCELRLRLNGVIGVDRSSRVSVRECSDRGYRKAAVVVRVVCAGMGRETLWQNYDSTAALLLRGAHALRGRDAW